MIRFTKFLSLAAVASLATGAFAQKTPLLKSHPTLIKPVSAQKIIRMYMANGQKKLELGPKQYFQDSQINPVKSSSVAFDLFEWDPSVFPNQIKPGDNPAYGTGCNSGDQRWYLGDQYTSGVNSYNDMTLVSGAAGVKAHRAAFAWNIFSDGVNPNTITNMAVIVTSCENNATTNPGGPFDGGANGRGDLSRYLFEYGTWTQLPSPNGGYLYSDVDSSQFTGGLSWQMPVDGNGSYFVSVGDYNSTTNTWVSDIAQNMLWGAQGTNGSSTDFMQFDDDATPNGLWSPATEYYNYNNNAACPVTWGAMVAFLYDQTAVLSPTATTAALGNIVSGNNASLASDDANALKVCKAFVPSSLTSPRVRIDSDFLSPYLTVSSVTMNLKARMSTAGVFKVRGFVADRTGGGFVYGAPNQVIADTAINTTFATYTGVSTNPAVNVFTDGTMRARIEIQQTGFSSVTTPCSEFELLSLTVNP